MSVLHTEADALVQATQARFDFGQREKSDLNRGASKKVGDGNNTPGAAATRR